jgi:Meiotically up-regulated gene 113
MARPSKGPHLFLRKPRLTADGKVHEKARWVIVDGRKEIGTGCPANERIAAEAKLERYKAENAGGLFVEREVKAYVYFVSAKKDGFPVKIGITESASGRFKNLQTHLPYELEILAMAPVKHLSLERVIHGKFAAHRLRGEWFERTPSLMAFIEEVRAANDISSGEPTGGQFRQGLKRHA